MKSVCLAGFASTKILTHDLPGDVPIWSLNNAWIHDFPRLDAIFDPHRLEHITDPAWCRNGRESHDRIDWLRSNTETPVYMVDAYEEIPMSRRYPFEAVVEMLGSSDDLTSTFALMMGNAILEGYELVYVYGFHMKAGTEYTYQLPGGKALIGFARGRGIKVIGPPESELFSPHKIYGLEGTAMITRRTIEQYQTIYRQQQTELEAEFNRWAGILKQRQKGFVKNGKIMGNRGPIEEASKTANELYIKNREAAAVIEAMQHLIDEADMKEVDPLMIGV